MDRRDHDVVDRTSPALRVVVIDDEPDIHTLVRVRLGQVDGLALIGMAYDAGTGLATVAEQQPDVVLLDLDLGGENGADLVGPLLRSCPRLMVAALSALPADRHEDRLRRLGAFAYYHKDSIMALPELIRRDYGMFCRALAGEDVVAPAAYAHDRTS